jgi:Protein of unknown function (DUF3168)
MSFAGSAALQSAVYQRLSAATALASVPIHDALPPGTGTGTFVLIGPEEVRDASDKSGAGAEHRFVVSVISDGSGFLAAKQVAVDVSDALVGATLVLSRGRLVHLVFQRATVRRIDEGEIRRVDLVFLARLEL